MFWTFVYLFLIILFIRTGTQNLSGSELMMEYDAGRTFRLSPTQFVTPGIKDPTVSTVMTFASINRLPSSANVWNSAITVKDQGPWGSCTAFSTRYAILINQLANNMPLTEPSVAFLYAKARIIMPGGPLRDSGSTLTAIMTVLDKEGLLTETNWPYTGANIFNNPSIRPAESTKIHIPVKIPIYRDLNYNITGIKRALSQGRPVLIAILVYSSFMSRTALTTGIIPTPGRFDSLQGGHAICLVGYDDSISRFIFYNSWGTYTGIGGRFTIPYEYVGNAKYAGEYYSF